MPPLVPLVMFAIPDVVSILEAPSESLTIKLKNNVVLLVGSLVMLQLGFMLTFVICGGLFPTVIETLVDWEVMVLPVIESNPSFKKSRTFA